jgi:hypothetical protein
MNIRQVIDGRQGVETPPHGGRQALQDRLRIVYAGRAEERDYFPSLRRQAARIERPRIFHERAADTPGLPWFQYGGDRRDEDLAGQLIDLPRLTALSVGATGAGDVPRKRPQGGEGGVGAHEGDTVADEELGRHEKRPPHGAGESRLAGSTPAAR